MKTVCLTLLALVCCSAVSGAEPTVPDPRQALAVLSGELHLKGLTRPVHVLRDRWGVAHIYAGN
ncbi:MAG: hypothetical protein JOZ11_20760, partial [Alphaproteobacteria bacterium]|nr:hypothetical protein [Alphaproteobacteria bacterium]